MSNKKKSIIDLNVLYKDLTIEDPDEPDVPFEYRVVKLNRPDHQLCVRKADAAQAAMTAKFRDENGEDFLAVVNQAADIDDPNVLVSYLIMDEFSKKQLSLQAKVADDDEWSNDSYLDGLREAWDDGLADRWVEDPDDPEAARVRGELERFAAQVQAVLDDELEVLKTDFADRPLHILQTEFARKMCRAVAADEWQRVYRLNRLFYSVRENVEGVGLQRLPRAFGDVDEVAMVDDSVLKQMDDVYDSIEVPAVEGK